MIIKIGSFLISYIISCSLSDYLYLLQQFIQEILPIYWFNYFISLHKFITTETFMAYTKNKHLAINWRKTYRKLLTYNYGIGKIHVSFISFWMTQSSVHEHCHFPFPRESKKKHTGMWHADRYFAPGKCYKSVVARCCTLRISDISVSETGLRFI